MKELSIEEKAKAYDEAIKRAQAKMEEAKVFDYDDEQTSYTIRLTTTDIFPELKESEDERIKEQIIWDRIKQMYNDMDDAAKSQVERAFPELTESEDEKIRKDIINYLALYKDAIGEEYESWIAWLEKQGEKPAEWSEEDKDMFKSIITRLHSHPDVDKTEYDKSYHWLKSLKDRIQPQHKQGWSKEDEKMLDEIHEFFDKHMINPIKHDMDDYAKFIKSLKNRVQPQSKSDWGEEVERLQNELIQEKEKGFGSDIDNVCILELQNVLTYIDSMQEEKKVLCGDSESECATNGVDNSLEGIIEAAILWGKYYYAENDIPREELNQAINYYCSLLNKEEPVSEELEEAIDTYLATYFGGEKEKQNWPFLKKMAIHFAKWQKDQMTARAIDAHCFGFQGAALFSFKLPADNYLIGSEVKVIVIKEN